MFTKKRRGISTFIATLLLILLAVAGGVVIYAYTMGYLGGLGGNPQTGAMSLDVSKGNTNTINATVRNIGKGSIAIDKVYLDGTDVTASTTFTASIAEGSTGTVRIAGTFTLQKTYTVKLVAKDNTQLSFSVTITS